MTNLRTTDAELAHIVLAERGYARSNVDDWIKHCSKELKSVDDVLAFIHSLPETCHKRREALRQLKDPFWVEDAERAIIVLGRSRNVCCACHLTGSFAEI